MSSLEFSGTPIERSGLLPVYILCDTSESMGRPVEAPVKPIDAVNSGLASIIQEINRQGQMGADIRLSVISFSTSTRAVLPLSEVNITTEIPELVAAGVTNLEHAIKTLSETISDDYHAIRDRGGRAYRPVVFVFTDGAPTNAQGIKVTDHSVWKRHLQALHTNDAWDPRVYAYGFGEANEQVLQDLVFIRDVPAPILENRAQLSHENAVQSIAKLFPELFRTLEAATNAAMNGASDDDITKVIDDIHKTKVFAEDADETKPIIGDFWSEVQR